MATTRRTATDGAGGNSLAAACRGADFLHLVAHADGAALAAAGLLARAADAPRQVSVVRTATAAERRTDGDPATTSVALGVDAAADAAGDLPAAVAAAEALDRADPALALAGVAAGDADSTLDLGLNDEADRRPGVAVPTADLDDSLAHSTLVHAPFSGDPDAAAATLAEFGRPADRGEQATRALASAVALDATTDAPPRAATAVERLLRPAVAGGPFETVGGYADVLDTAARADPGAAAALALGHDRGAALEAWREAAQAVHGSLHGSDPARHSGVVTARVAGPVWTAARLLRDYCSREPAALALGEGELALATTDTDARRVLAAAADAVGGRSDLAYAETDDVEALTETVRGAV
jgi:hypothetical protein